MTTHQVTRPTDLPPVLSTAEGFPEVLAALDRRAAVTVDGAWGSSSALSAAVLARSAPSTLLVVLAHTGDLEAWSEDLRTFTGVRPVIFPAHESWPATERSAFDDAGRRRLRMLQQTPGTSVPIILTTVSALMQPVPDAAQLAERARRIAVGQSLDSDEFAGWLVDRGYKRVDACEYPGEFSRRGGILDVFSLDGENPVRMELFGDDVDSIRTFSAGSQRSGAAVTEAIVLGGTDGTSGPVRGSLFDHLPDTVRIALIEPGELVEQGKFFLESVETMVGLFPIDAVLAQAMQRPHAVISAMPRPTLETAVHLRVESVERFSGNVVQVREELDAVVRNDRILITCNTDAEIHRLHEVLGTGKAAQEGRLHLVLGAVRSGFRLVEAGIVVLGSHELFHREPTVGGEKSAVLPKRRVESRAIDSFLELSEGDYVVHVAHGIALFRGMKMLPRSKGLTPTDEGKATGNLEALEENLVLEFRDGVLLYVPVARIDLVQKYVGGSKSQPELSKVGGTAWSKRVGRVEEAVHDLASDMIQVQAMREAQPGFAFPEDTEWQREFEATFPFQETPDQLTAIGEIKGDLRRARPMDRLLCGDVGYGKTEVAVRAAFKVVDAGRQAAVLVPTTVLAEQHFRTFRSRFAEYPFVIEVLSRFRSAKEQKRILKALEEGTVDIVVGTHRLVSKDVKFKDLGLVIIDEEQRFGVEAKERLKQLRSMVDVLTMTATPIPRTLHLALLGIREISNLETPPPGRLPVETRIVRWDDKLIRAAILRELSRDGQVYFVHNRVMDIHDIAGKLAVIVPEAKIVVGHGQMAEGELEQAMIRFVRKEADILVATTIIESGLDIPNANTIFINEADHYGLADLHQLRGRVGRQALRAYAYLLLHPDRGVTGNAGKRLKAIEEFTELGAGFKIAMRDLEIRGAGNILGTQQSGHIAAVGYELYCQILENAVRQMKDMPLRESFDTAVDLPWPAYLPRDYVVGQKPRLEVYRRLARIRESAVLVEFREELRERYGPIPSAAEWFLRLAEIRIGAGRLGFTSLHRNGPHLIFTGRRTAETTQWVNRYPGRLRIIDEREVFLRLEEGDDDPEKMYAMLAQLLAKPSPFTANRN